MLPISQFCSDVQFAKAPLELMDFITVAIGALTVTSDVQSIKAPSGINGSFGKDIDVRPVHFQKLYAGNFQYV